MWDQLANAVEVRTTEKLVQLFILFCRPWARLDVFNDEEEKDFTGRDESVLYII